MTNAEVAKIVMTKLIECGFFTEPKSVEMANLVINDEDYLVAMLTVINVIVSLDPRLLDIMNERAARLKLIMSILGDN